MIKAKNKKPNFKKVSKDELEKIKSEIRLKLKKQRKEENQQSYGAFIIYFSQAILIAYGLYKAFMTK